MENTRKKSHFFVSFSNVKKTRTHLCVMKKQIRNLPFFFFLSPIIYSPDFTVVFIFMWLFCVWKCGFSLLPIFATIFLNICLISIDLTVVVGTPATPCLHYSNERRETHKKIKLENANNPNCCYCQCEIKKIDSSL